MTIKNLAEHYHHIYYKWVNKYHPDAAKYPHNGISMNDKKLLKISYKGRMYSLKSILDILKNKYRNSYTKKYGMNPIDYWYKNNIELKNKIDTYYLENIKLVKDEEIKDDMINLYERGNTKEKIQVISVLTLIKKYFKE